MCGEKALKRVSMHARCKFMVQSKYIVVNYVAFSAWNLADDAKIPASVSESKTTHKFRQDLLFLEQSLFDPREVPF